MHICKCGKTFDKAGSLRSHARFCAVYEKINKVSEYKREDVYVCECGRSFEKFQSLNAHFSYCFIHRNGAAVVDRYGESRKWNKGLTKETDPRIKSYAKTCSLKMKGKPGRPHTLESRQKLANSAKEHNNGYVRTVWFDIFCPTMNTFVKVQGTWEKQFAEKLNELDIPWERGKSYKISYIKDSDKIVHNYHPDFYLPTIDTYVEIKGYWWKSKDGRVDDKKKMQNIVDQHPEFNILILDSIEKIQNFKMPA